MVRRRRERQGASSALQATEKQRTGNSQGVPKRNLPANGRAPLMIGPIMELGGIFYYFHLEGGRRQGDGAYLVIFTITINIVIFPPWVGTGLTGRTRTPSAFSTLTARLRPHVRYAYSSFRLFVSCMCS